MKDTPPRFDLAEALRHVNAEVMIKMMVLLGVPKPHPTRKDQMIQEIVRRLRGSHLREVWEVLDPLQQNAIRETIYASDRVFNSLSFRAKYGGMPKGYKPKYNQTSPLRLFLYCESRHSYEPMRVPDDLRDGLLEFVPSPEKPKLTSLKELPETVSVLNLDPGSGSSEDWYKDVPLTRRDMERAALQDLRSVLRLADQGRVSVSAQTKRPAKATWQRIAGVLAEGDFFDLTEEKKDKWDQVPGPVKSFAWPLLLQVGGLAESKGPKLALTKAGRTALNEPPAKTLRELFGEWLDTSPIDEFSRIEAIKGQSRGGMTSHYERREAVVEALAECPVGEWVKFADFSLFMRAAGYLFEVTTDPWNLYISDSQYGNLGYEGHHTWEILQDRYVLCCLMEFVATLGMIDLAYVHPAGARSDLDELWDGGGGLKFLSRYDGLCYFRLNALGAYCLEITGEYVPGASEDKTGLTVFPDLRVCANGPLPADECLFLDTYAVAEAEGVWRLNFDKVLACVEAGHDLVDLRRFLNSRDEQPLPERAEGLLQRAEKGARALKSLGAATLIECVDESTAERLASDKVTRKFCRRSGDRHLVVLTRNETRFLKAARAMGFGMMQAE